jgi:hypothetical protein
LVTALIVSLLTLSVSGISSVIVDEPCTELELTEQGEDDGGCPPTCVTCGCCAQSVEAAVFAVAISPDAPNADRVAALSDVLNADPRDILHVPRSALA